MLSACSTGGTEVSSLVVSGCSGRKVRPGCQGPNPGPACLPVTPSTCPSSFPSCSCPPTPSNIQAAIWGNAYLYTSQDYAFNSGTFLYDTFVGMGATVLNRDLMLQGAPLFLSVDRRQYRVPVSIPTNIVLPADAQGSALTPPPGAPAFLLGLEVPSSPPFSGNLLLYFRLQINFLSPPNPSLDLTGPFYLPVNLFTGVTSVPQPSGAPNLEAFGDQIMQRVAYRNVRTSRRTNGSPAATKAARLPAPCGRRLIRGANLDTDRPTNTCCLLIIPPLDRYIAPMYVPLPSL